MEDILIAIGINVVGTIIGGVATYRRRATKDMKWHRCFLKKLLL